MAEHKKRRSSFSVFLDTINTTSNNNNANNNNINVNFNPTKEQCARSKLKFRFPSTCNFSSADND